MTKRKGKQHRVDTFDRVPPTPETAAKLVRDDWRQTELNADQQVAADRILSAYCILTTGLGARVNDFTRTDKSIAHENLGEEILERNYREWWRACAGKKINVTRVHGVLVDPLSEIRKELDGPVAHRYVTSLDTGARAMMGDIEACLNEYIRLGGGRVIDRKTA